MEPTKETHPSDDQKESSGFKKKSPNPLYLAGGAGGFLICLIDQISNGENAVIGKIAEVLGVWFKSTNVVDYGYLPALILIVLIAVFLCWLFEPKTKLDAFARGFAVFAVLNLTPGVESTGKAPSYTVNTTTYEAVSYHRLEHAAFAGLEVRDAKVALRLVSDKDLSEMLTLVTVRDPHTARVIYRDYWKSDLVILDILPGIHRFELDVPGHRRSEFTIKVDAGQTNAFRVDLTASTVPLGVQRLYGFQKITPVKDAELQREVDQRHGVVPEPPRGVQST